MGPYPSNHAENSLRNRIANTLSDAWHDGEKQTIDGFTVERIDDTLVVTLPDGTAQAATRAGAEDFLFNQLGENIVFDDDDDDDIDPDDDEDFDDDDFEDEDPDCGDDDDEDILVDIEDDDDDEVLGSDDDRNLSETGGA